MIKLYYEFFYTFVASSRLPRAFDLKEQKNKFHLINQQIWFLSP
jgi:hypothetical protein